MCGEQQSDEGARIRKEIDRSVNVYIKPLEPSSHATEKIRKKEWMVSVGITRNLALHRGRRFALIGNHSCCLHSPVKSKVSPYKVSYCYHRSWQQNSQCIEVFPSPSHPPRIPRFQHSILAPLPVHILGIPSFPGRRPLPSHCYTNTHNKANDLNNCREVLREIAWLGGFLGESWGRI